MSIHGVIVDHFSSFPDERGVNLFPFHHANFKAKNGFEFPIEQLNVTHCRPHTFRGIHYSVDQPGQAKLIMVTAGSIIDVLVDVRINSPTFRKVQKIALNSKEPVIVYVPAGVGHGIWCPQGNATVLYACSRAYIPECEKSIWPLDPELALALPEDLILSEKDNTAPRFSHAQLPEYFR